MKDALTEWMDLNDDEPKFIITLIMNACTGGDQDESSDKNYVDNWTADRVEQRFFVTEQEIMNVYSG